MFRITEDPSSGSHNTDYVHVNGHDKAIFIILAKHYTKLPDGGSSMIRNTSEHF